MGYMIRSVLLLGVLTGLFLFVGNLIGGKTGMTIALILAGIMNFIAYWFSDRIVLAMYGAREITEEEALGYIGWWKNLPKGQTYQSLKYTLFPWNSLTPLPPAGVPVTLRWQ